MKALTNILSHLLMLLMLFIVACTEETAEVDNLMRQEQYVTVRMNIPGMTATATRADADGDIKNITALAFDDADKLLEIETITTVTNTNSNGGFNGTFNLTVPNGTTTIHFLANLPLNYSNEQTYVDFLKAKKGQSQVDVMTSLTTGDYQNLCYWGMATTYDGNTDPLSVTLYRNMAKITLSPSIIDPEFNDAFDETNLYIAGLDNPNLSGKLVPYNNGFYSHYQGVAPDYTTIPDGVQIFDHTFEVTEEGVYGYGRSLYVFEHENSNYIDKGLFVICRIGDAFYKVALTSDGVNPYQIIRNHEYIIYVSDVDDYQTDEYRSTYYYDTFNKTPINLEVKEVESVTFNASAQSIDVDGNLTVTMTVPEEGTVTALTISAPGFTIKRGETPLGADSYTGSGLNIVGNSTVTYTFVPNTFGKGKEITFTASGTNLQETPKNIYVDVNAAISASPTVNNPTLYYDQDGQTVTVNVTMPKGLSAINIGGAENFTVSQDGKAVPIDNDVYTYTRNDATTTQEVQFLFTLDKSKYTSQQGNTSATFTFSDASTAVDKATSASPVYVSLIPTPEVRFQYTDNVTLYLNNNDTYTITMNVPNDGTLTALNIEAEGFVIKQGNTELGTDSYSNNALSYSNTQITYTFVPTSIGAKTISINGSGTNTKVTSVENIIVTVKAAITATATDANPVLYYNGTDAQTVTINVTIPEGVTALSIGDADNFTISTTADGTLNSTTTYTVGNDRVVSFVFTLNTTTVPQEDDIRNITFSDASDSEYIDGDAVEVEITKEPVQGETIIFDLSTKTSITITFNKPEGVTDLAVDIAGGNPLSLDNSDCSHKYTWSSEHSYYYETNNLNSAAATMTFTFKMKANFLETAGDYVVSFATRDGSQTFGSKTIRIQVDYDDTNTIWEKEGGRVISNDRTYLTSASLEGFEGQKLGFVVQATGESPQFSLNDNIHFNNFNGEEDAIVEYEIPSEMGSNIWLTGNNVILKRVYVIPSTK